MVLERAGTVRLDGKRQKLTRRKKLRLFLEELKVEATIMILVIVYALFIFADLLLAGKEVERNVTNVETGEWEMKWEQSRTAWDDLFKVVDMVFLSFFVIELLLKLYAWGPLNYLSNPLDTFDASVVVISFIFAVVMLSLETSTNLMEQASTLVTLARLVRLVRIFRLVTVMNKIQKSRASAHVLRKKQKYKKLGSPVEKVLEILVRMKSEKLEANSDRENIAFIMDIIISDQLYAVNIGNLGKEMLNFVGNMGVVTAQRKTGEVTKEEADKEGGQLTTGRRHSDPNPEVTRWVDKLVAGDKLSATLANVHRWDFDYFSFEAEASGHPLVVMGVQMIRKNGLEDSLGLDLGKVVRFLGKIEAGYKPIESVPFHNRSHAADVVQSTSYFLNQARVKAHITPVDIYALILAAAIHDHGHPGINNAFLVNARDELAILYNDASVLEMFHLASSWRLMLAPECNALEGLTQEQCADVRQTIVQCIIGTDMKFHFEHLTKFKTRASAGAFDAPDKKDVRLVLAMCLHSADVSNPAKPWALSREWSARVMDEFFRQGDREQGKGMPISPFMDREKTDISKCQIGFINILIKPYFEEWAQFLGDVGDELVANIVANINMWETEGESAMGAERVAQIKAVPAVTAPPAGAPRPAPPSTSKGSSVLNVGVVKH